MDSKFYAQAEVLVEIVRQGSMTAAAATLRLSKSNVSQKLAEMEAELDVTLLKRNTRAIELTTMGAKVYALCVKAVDTLQLARGEVSSELRVKEPQGTVNISGSNLYLTEFILPLLSGLQDRFPKVRIDLTGGDAPLDQRAEPVDLRVRVGDVNTDGLKVYQLPPLERILCIHKRLLSASKNTSGQEVLSSLPLILRIQENPEWVFHSIEGTMKHRVADPALCVNSYELCVAAVRSGLGAAILTKAVVQKDVAAGNIVELLPDWKVDPISVSLMVPVSRLRRSEVAVVAKYIASSLASDPLNPN